jgi:hypothetical protein
MSEKIFACFLRLYPSRFRKKYTEEAIQLYRDLYRQETGLLQRMRLWFRLLADLAAGLPLAYRNIYDSPPASPIAQGVPGMPTFRLLDQEPVRPGLFLFGSVLTLALLGTFSIVLSHPATYPVWDESSVSRSPIEAVLERLNRSTSSGQSGNESPQTDDSIPRDARNGVTQKASSLAAQPAGVKPQKAIQPAVVSPEAHPPYQQGSKNTQQAIQPNQQHGPYNSAAGETSSVTRPTPDLQPTKLETQKPVAYQTNPVPSRNGLSALAISPTRVPTKQPDCNFTKIEVLPHNIGYLKLDSFPDPEVCGASANRAMTRLNETSAIVFDLRQNRGGDPEMAKQIAAWLFERPAAWYNPGERSVRQSKTHSPVPASKLASKPVYILTSSVTSDGAERFAYNLKLLKRATVIGERTRSEAAGVAPDVEVKASGALQIAEESARARIGTGPSPDF